MLAIRKHVSLIQEARGEMLVYALLGPCGARIPAFDLFVQSIQDGKPNTVKSYCTAVADFFDYFFEAAIHLSADREPSELTRQDLRNIVFSWKQYLTLGVHAESELAAGVAAALKQRLVKEGTAANKLAGLSKFLRLSEQVRKESLDLQKVGLLLVEIDFLPLLGELSQLRTADIFQHRQMLRNSMLTGVLKTQASPRPAALFSTEVASEFDHRSLFPMDRFDDFIRTLRKSRDKALYCFYAASGCRSNEGLQLLWEDIDFETGEVRLVSPSSRIAHPSYLALTKKERRQLTWKGRNTPITFLIEPYASMFFEHLADYLRNEYFPHGRHNFVFQVINRPDKGRPYFLSDPSSRRDIFKRAKAMVKLPVYVAGPHSLRHSYGTYLLNYIPVANGGYGLPIGLVKVTMGHAAIKNTQKYAIVDKDLVSAEIEFANMNVFHRGAAKTQSELKIDALKAQILQLEK